MTIKEIIAQELNNENSIYLLKEGIFWHAYNQSAMRFVNKLKPLKIIRKYIKKAGQEIFYCGFPDGSLEEIKKKAKEKGFEFTETGDKKITIGGTFTADNYENWTESQPVANEPTVQYAKRSETGEIIRQIQNYQLEDATPMDTMLFVQKLKQSIKDGIIL